MDASQRIDRQRSQICFRSGNDAQVNQAVSSASCRKRTCFTHFSRSYRQRCRQRTAVINRILANTVQNRVDVCRALRVLRFTNLTRGVDGQNHDGSEDDDGSHDEEDFQKREACLLFLLDHTSVLVFILISE